MDTSSWLPSLLCCIFSSCQAAQSFSSTSSLALLRGASPAYRMVTLAPSAAASAAAASGTTDFTAAPSVSPPPAATDGVVSCAAASCAVGTPEPPGALRARLAWGCGSRVRCQCGCLLLCQLQLSHLAAAIQIRLLCSRRAFSEAGRFRFGAKLL